MNQARTRIVAKFGGSSVSTPDRWQRIRAILNDALERGEHPLVVHSALSGVTDLLEQSLEAAPSDGHHEALARIHERHDQLAAGLGLDPRPILHDDRAHLDRLLSGIALLGEAPPRIRAEVLSSGERMATRLGAHWLNTEGLPVTWLDARELLTSLEPEHSGPTAWLAARCGTDLDPSLIERLDHIDGVALTQGFTARNAAGETVVLGRGGSDTAAAYLASRIGAERLEIWSDVPGMFTADPRRVPQTRLLRRLDYREAQEIATTGGQVLHPRCVPAVRDRGIPIHMRSTLDPELPGTVISAIPDDGPASLKAISTKSNVVLLSLETLGMWQEVGFLARATQVLVQAGLSLDLVSTSESNVTLSLDAAANLLDEALLDRVCDELGEFCRVEVIRPCAAISLVGNRIRGLLHRLGPALEAFEEHRVHLVSQAASDLNVTFVVDEDQADRLVRTLHAQLIGSSGPAATFGPSQQELDSGSHELEEASSVWWRRRRGELLEIASEHPSAYVYDLPTVRERLESLSALRRIDRTFYAMKANPHPVILSTVAEAGWGFECVSLGELRHLRSTVPDLAPDRILFTPNFAPREEYAAALAAGVHVTLDALHPLEHWPELFEGREVLVRLDPGWGSGHHEKVVTGGRQAKFGIPISEIDELAGLLARAGARAVGVHTHSGSGILDPSHWRRVAETLSRVARALPDVRIVNVGGGLGVPEKPGQPALDLDRLALELSQADAASRDLELWMEPGRFVVTEAGVLLARVTQVKGKGDLRYVGLSTGMNSLIRPALYGAWHDIVNLTRLGEPSAGLAQIVGPICETGDRLGNDRPLPETTEGDVVLIATAGAYGRAMASRYNLRDPAPEFVLDAEERAAAR